MSARHVPGCIGPLARRLAAARVNNRRRLTGELAVRLGLFFRTSPEFWMNLHIEGARDAIPPQEAASIASGFAA